MVETNIDLVLNVLTEEQYKNITPNKDELYFVDDNEKPSLQPFKFDAVKLMSIASGETVNEATLLSNGVFTSKDEMIRYITDYFNEDSIDIVVTYQTGVSNYLFTEAFQKDKLPLLDNQGQPTQGFTVYSISFKLTMQGAIANISFKLIHNEAENLFAGQTYLVNGITDDQIQTKEDQALTTTSKEIVGAINEVNAKPTGVYVNGKTIENHILGEDIDKGDLVFFEDCFNFDLNSKLPALEASPGSASGCSFSPDGNYLAVAHDNTPYITVYKRSSDIFTKLPVLEALPYNGYGCSFSPDGNYLAVVYFSAPYITIYKRSADVFTKLSVLEALPGRGSSCSFSPDGNYLAVTHYSSPYITVYKRSSDIFTKLPALETLPYSGRGCSFSPDGNYLAVAHDNAPYITVYKRSSDTFIKLSALEALPGNGMSCSFSSDGNYLAVAHDNVPCITVYKRSSDTFIKLSALEALPYSGRGCSFSPDGNYLAVAHGGSPYITVYKRSSDAFSKLSALEALPGSGMGCSFSSDSNYLAVAHGGSPYITVYKVNINSTIKIFARIKRKETDKAKGIALESGVAEETKRILITEKYY